MSQIRSAIVFACSLAAVSGVAHAEDHAVLRRLSSNGKLTSTHAKQLANKVTQRLARAADAPPTTVDPLRAALSQALLGTPMPPDQISAAKVRLKLYAGLNEFALESIFAPRKGAVATCERDAELSKKECEALVAAAGKMPLSKVKRVAAGPATAPMMAAAPVAPAAAPMAAAPAGGGRFGNRFNAGAQAPQQGYPQQQQAYAPPQQQGSWQPQRFQQAPQPQAYPQQQQGYAQRQAYPQQQPQQGYAQQGSRFGGAAPQQGSRFGGGAPAAAPAPVAQPMAAAPRPAPAAAPAPTQVAMRPAAAAPAYVAAAPAAPAVGAADAEARKEQYKAQREAYMARQKQLFEERKAKLTGANAPPPAAEPKPAAAPVAKAQPKEAEPETPLDADMKAAVGESAAPAAGAGKAGLDGEFLDGLLDDPMGGSGKKK